VKNEHWILVEVDLPSNLVVLFLGTIKMVYKKKSKYFLKINKYTHTHRHRHHPLPPFFNPHPPFPMQLSLNRIVFV